MASFFRVRWRLLILAVVVMAAIAEACSLFIPFDDYPGDPFDSGAGAADQSAFGDAGGLEDVVDEEAAANGCRGINRQTDPNHCGACNRKCLTGTCDSGRCDIELVSALEDAGTILSIAPDVLSDGGVNVLYLTRSKGSIGRVPVQPPVDGTNQEEERYMGSGSPPPIGDITVNFTGSQVLYIADGGIIGVRTAPTFGTGQVDVIVKRQDVRVASVRGNSNILYFGDATGLNWTQANNVFRADASFDGSVTDNPVVALTTSGQTLLWTTDRGEVYRMLTLTPENPATVMKPTDRAGTTSIAVMGKRLYLGQRSQGIIMFPYETTADPTKPTQVTAFDVRGLAADEGHIYAIDYGTNGKDGRLLRIDADTSNFAVLANSLSQSVSLAVIGGYVYFSDGERLLRTSK